MVSSPVSRRGSLAAAGILLGLLVGCSGGASGGSQETVKGDPVHGKELYTQCQACHKQAENYVGPQHCGLIGRPAGTVPGFAYSDGMQASGITWTPKTLDEFLTSPIAYVNGTKMGFAGFDSATDRADVIAYIVQFNHDPSVCPPKK
jgi:cytochrome c